MWKNSQKVMKSNEIIDFILAAKPVKFYELFSRLLQIFK